MTPITRLKTGDRALRLHDLDGLDTPEAHNRAEPNPFEDRIASEYDAQGLQTEFNGKRNRT